MPEFFHWLTTSRYTRRLEWENEQLRADNRALLAACSPVIRQALGQPQTPPATAQQIVEAKTRGAFRPFQIRQTFSDIRARLEAKHDTKRQTAQLVADQVAKAQRGELSGGI